MFKKGTSGNPAGRPRKTTTLAAFKSSLSIAIPDILDALIESAKAGDTGAAKILMDRIYPTLKPQSVPVSVPVAATLADQGNEIIRSTMTGTLTPDTCYQLLSSLASQTKIVEVDELIKRIERLENGNH